MPVGIDRRTRYQLRRYLADDLDAIADRHKMVGLPFKAKSGRPRRRQPQARHPVIGQLGHLDDLTGVIVDGRPAVRTGQADVTVAKAKERLIARAMQCSARPLSLLAIIKPSKAMTWVCVNAFGIWSG